MRFTKSARQRSWAHRRRGLAVPSVRRRRAIPAPISGGIAVVWGRRRGHEEASPPDEAMGGRRRGHLTVRRRRAPRPRPLPAPPTHWDAGPYLASCSKRGNRFVCDNSCFASQLRSTSLEVGTWGHITIGDWDGDGDLDVVSIRDGHENSVIFFDQNFCVPPTPCSGIGMCQASGRCSCGKDRGLEDCSGCGASHYMVSKQPALDIIHRCAPCPMPKNQVCAGRGVCVDDLYAKAVGDAWDVGNGSCICAETFFNGSDQWSRQTCAQGTCPGGFQETLLPAEHLKHPRIKTCLACEACDAGTFAAPGGQCKSCHPGYFSSHGSHSCSPCPAGSSSRTLGAVECSLCSAGTYAPSGSAVCHQCAEGTISVKGSAKCEPCNSRSIFWVHADNQNLTCIRPSEQYLILLLFFASSSVCLFFVATALAYRIPVSDISTQNDDTVVTTHGAHRVLQASSDAQLRLQNANFLLGSGFSVARPAAPREN